MMYAGFKTLFTQERAIMSSAPSNTQKKKAAAEGARLAMVRNEAYSNMVQDLFSSHIRFSIHPHDNVKKELKLALLLYT